MRQKHSEHSILILTYGAKNTSSCCEALVQSSVTLDQIPNTSNPKCKSQIGRAIHPDSERLLGTWSWQYIVYLKSSFFRRLVKKLINNRNTVIANHGISQNLNVQKCFTEAVRLEVETPGGVEEWPAADLDWLSRKLFRALDRSKEKRWSGGYQGPGKPLQAQEGDPCQREENQFY